MYFKRKLLYIPIIHMSADLGTLSHEIDKKGIERVGKKLWERHKEVISGFWNSVVTYLKSLDVKGFKIYQDGMIADGEVGMRIVKEGIKGGSKNYEIIAELLKGGAILVKTEDFALVKMEHDKIKKLAQSKSIMDKFTAYLDYRVTKNSLLNERDKFIAMRIDRTLNHGETGILFLGAYHNIIAKLPKDIHIIQLKDQNKIKEYQRLFLHWKKDEKRFEELANYLTSCVSI
ncbi:MAG: hypothetical protein AB1410_06430 [Acidobacteriota bacterium]